MLSEYPAGDLRFEGLGADGATVEEASQQLAGALARWAEVHSECRLIQLAVLPAAPASGGRSHAAMAVLTFVEPALDGDATAAAVAAAVEEIHEAQVVADDEPADGTLS
jgi:hypothetical protein